MSYCKLVLVMRFLYLRLCKRTVDYEMYIQSCESSLNIAKNYWLLSSFLIKSHKKYKADRFSRDNKDTCIHVMLTCYSGTTWRRGNICQWFVPLCTSHHTASRQLQGGCFIPRALHLYVTFDTNLLHHLNHSL